MKIKSTSMLCALAATAVLPCVANAGEAPAAYPSKPITVVVPYAVGSGSDQWMRGLGQVISRDNKVPVIIDNKLKMPPVHTTAGDRIPHARVPA